MSLSEADLREWCEKCHQARLGTSYRVIYGRHVGHSVAGSGAPGGQIVHTDRYQVLGDESVLVCRRCVLKRLVMSKLVAPVLALLLLATCLVIGYGVVSAIGEWVSDSLRIWVVIGVLVVLWIPGAFAVFALKSLGSQFLSGWRTNGEEVGWRVIRDRVEAIHGNAVRHFTSAEYRKF